MRNMKTLRIFAVFFFFLLMAGSCARVTTVKPDLTLDASGVKWVKQTMGKMALEEKVGQMVACRFSGRFANRESEVFRELEEFVVRHKVGGFILFGGDVYETAVLTNTLQEMADTPLLIASDFERGAGNQVEGATLFPPLMSLGAADSEELAYAMGKITALEGRAMGIHMTYAPVVDVNINPENPIINTRSVGEDPELVARISRAFIKGCQDHGLMATAKHFPGHGDTDLDSHSVLATIEGERERLEKVELLPFRKAVEAGVKAVMTAHLRVPALDPTPDLPATLSPVILTDLLRREIGFEGIIVTDSMGMGGITTLYAPEEAAVRAIKAGVDMLLLPPRPREVIRAVVRAVRRGGIPASRIDESVERILEAKARLGLHRRRTVDIDALALRVGKKEFQDQAKAAFERSMTLVKNEGGLLPLTDEPRKLAVFSLSSDLGGYFAGRVFVREMGKRTPLLATCFAEPTTGTEYLEEAMGKAVEAEAVVVGLFSRLRANKGSVGLDPRHVDFIRELSAGEVPVVVVSFGSPYFLRHFPEVDAYLCAYRYAGEAQEAAVKALFGEIPVEGRLPVSIPGLFPRGHGIRLAGKGVD